MLARKWVVGAPLLLSLMLAMLSYAQAPAKPLAEPELLSLLSLGLDDATVIARIKSGGLAFEPSAAVQQKLKAAGASDAVLQAVREAAQAKPAAPGINAVTFDQVVQMLSLGIDEVGVLKRLAASPTTFVLSPEQVQALKQADSAVKNRIGSVTKYDDYLSIPSATNKYAVVWQPKQGRWVFLLRDFSIPERKVVDIRPESILGMIQVSGTGKPNSIYVLRAGDRGAVKTRIQDAERYDQIMVVPAGKYDVYVNRSLIEEGLDVQPGTLQRLQ
jgi:hypothetical protein